MKIHDTVTFKINDIPHAQIEVIVSREVTKRAGYEFYSRNCSYVALLKKADGSSHVVTTGWGGFDLPDNRMLHVSDLTSLKESITSDLLVHFRDKEWALT